MCPFSKHEIAQYPLKIPNPPVPVPTTAVTLLLEIPPSKYMVTTVVRIATSTAAQTGDNPSVDKVAKIEIQYIQM